MKKFTPLTYVSLFIIVVLMFFSYKLKNERSQIEESKKLPFYNVKVEDVQDGTYISSTKTSFLHLKLSVTVKDKKITNINILEKKGSKGKKVDSIINKMIEQNKTTVSAIEKEELASFVFISCVDSALKQGLPQDTKKE